MEGGVAASSGERDDCRGHNGEAAIVTPGRCRCERCKLSTKMTIRNGPMPLPWVTPLMASLGKGAIDVYLDGRSLLIRVED